MIPDTMSTLRTREELCSADRGCFHEEPIQMVRLALLRWQALHHQMLHRPVPANVVITPEGSIFLILLFVKSDI